MVHSHASLGQPIWLDIGVPDLAGAEEFYASVFGWTFVDIGEEFGHYQRVFAADGTPVGGMLPRANAARDADPADSGNPADGANPAGGPSPDDDDNVFWNCYFFTPDINDTLTKAEANGGTIIVPSMPVGELGTRAIVLAPSGAQFGLWEPGTLAGFEISGTSGTVALFDTASMAFERDTAFYQAVFDWDLVFGDGPDQAGTASVGPLESADVCLFDGTGWFGAGAKSRWRVFFATDDIAAAARAVTAAGGQVTDGPEDIGDGLCATAVDPAGASFLLWQRATQDRP